MACLKMAEKIIENFQSLNLFRNCDLTKTCTLTITNFSTEQMNSCDLRKRFDGTSSFPVKGFRVLCRTTVSSLHNGKLFAKKMAPTICAERLDLDPPKKVTPSALCNCPGYQKSLATALERDEKIREKLI